MALLSVNQIHQVLAEEARAAASLSQSSNSGSAAAPPKGAELSSLLAKHQLTPDDILENLRSNMVAGETGAVRQKAVDTALKLNGMLTPDGPQMDFSVTINIIDPQYGNGAENPILIPR